MCSAEVEKGEKQNDSSEMGPPAVVAENPIEERAKRSFTIKIDRTTYEVHEHELTGLQLRGLPTPSIGPDRDLFEVVPGGSDKKILDTEEVNMRDGLRFFTAPAQINPGSGD